MKHNNTRASKDFIVLWLTQSLSSLGTSMTSYALILWSYRRLGTASSIAFLAAFTVLPSIFISFIAGTIADRWNKKLVMGIGDGVAAMGTLAVLLLDRSGSLAPWHLYIINFLLSCMNAFQTPAANVIITLLTPKKHFARANGMFALSGSISSLITPMVTTFIFATYGLTSVLLVDLATFAVAVSALLFFIQVPNTPRPVENERESFWKSCLFGVQYLLRNRPMLNLALLFMWLNLFAHLGTMGIAPALILARTGDSEAALGMFNTAIGIGALIGGALMALWRPAKSRTKTLLWACLAMCFLTDLPLALGRSLPVWVIGALLGNVALPILNANLTACMRAKVPIELQGRVFSARDTLQLWTMPVGLFLGGILADRVMEPLMAQSSPLQQFLTGIVGAGHGSGMALQVLLTVIATISVAVYALFDRRYRALDEPFTFSEKMDYARLIEEIEQEKAKERKSMGGTIAGRGRDKKDMDHGPQPITGTSRDIIGSKIGMSGRNYARAKHIADHATPEVIDELDDGTRTIRGTYDELQRPEKVKRPAQPNVITESVPPIKPKSDLERAIRAESELDAYKYRQHNEIYHRDSIMDSLKRRVAELELALEAAYARIRELGGTTQ